ncbi:MAG: hypothetical protein RMJ53_06205 [Chitinophagales bacterium]|nr:hypothetical protein [Chitinophagales bacterium]
MGKRVRVRLAWDGLINLGMSGDTYTDEHGTAQIEHKSEGMAEIYANGRLIGKMKTSGSHTFTVDMG